MKKTTLCYIEKDNKYLMLYRNKKENDLNEGKWVGIGGKFEEGESPEECLLREALEETGFILTDYDFRGLIRFSSDIWGTEYMYLYKATGFEGTLLECNEGEFHWIEKSQVASLPIWEGDKEIFKALDNYPDFFTMEVAYKGDTLVNKPLCTPSPIGKLYELQDKKYAAFQASLTPNIPASNFIGVRIPILRKFAKEFMKAKGCKDFLNCLPHIFYDENLLHGTIISEIKDYNLCMDLLEDFLPHVDNWAVCDTMSPKIFKKHKTQLLEKIKLWIQSSHTYTKRFGLKILMSHFLDEDFKPEYLRLAAEVTGEDYYIKMMVAWFFATALAKQWETTIPYLKNKELTPWVHNKTIQKSRESYRISPDQKEYLLTLKV